jgi:putative thioredoxin
MMSPLTQPYLESLLSSRLPPFLVVIYFTADWCGPCKKVGLQRIVNLRKDIQWMVCDVDKNDYSAGYCQVRSIPSWLALVRGKPLPLFQSSDDKEICLWLSKLPTNLETPASASIAPVAEAPPRSY